MFTRRKKIAIVVVLLCAPVLYLVGESLWGGRALAGWEKEALAKGEIFDIQTLTPRLPPTEKNGAMNLLAVARPVPPSSALSPLYSQNFVTPGKVVGMLAREEWARLFKDENNPAGTNMNWASAVAELEASARTVEAIQAAVRQGELNFNVNYRQGFSFALTHLTSLKPPAQWLAAAAMVELHRGRHEEALVELTDAATYVRRQGDEPLMISQLVRIACAVIAMNGTWQALQAPGWTEPQLARLQGAWTRTKLPEGMLAALIMERAMVRLEFDLCRRTPGRLIDSQDSIFAVSGSPTEGIIGVLMGPLQPQLRRNVYAPLWSFAWADQDELKFLRRGQHMIDRARVAVKGGSLMEGGLERAADELNLSRETRVEPRGFRHPLAAQMDFGMYGNVMTKAFRTETQRELLMTAIALRRHLLAQGRYPATLGELVPRFLPETPRDFMNGRTLGYRLKEDGTYVLYSVGEDFQDNGGDPSPKDATARPTFINGRDFVWPWPASPEEIESHLARQKRPRRK
jgi:hypothetical protein